MSPMEKRCPVAVSAYGHRFGEGAIEGNWRRESGSGSFA